MKLEELEKHGASKEVLKALSSTGLSELYPPQAVAVREGLLSGDDSFVVAAPTASGKTLIAEMALLKAHYEQRGTSVYLVPLRALAREKYEEFSAKYPRLRVIQSTGDLDSADPWLHSADLVIATNEKMDSLIRHSAPWLNDLGLVIADEVHLLSDPRRGPTLEVVLTRLRSMKPEMRVLALSATIPNSSDIARWLDARLVESDWRPVPLRQGVYFNGAGIFDNGTVKWIPETSGSGEIDLALETLGEGGQAIIFVNTRKSTEAVARKAAEHVPLSEEEESDLARLSSDVLTVTREPTRICLKLSEYVRRGVAFHHAGIHYSQRRLVEDAFRANRLKVIASTTTLAMGLNLPSRRVIIRDWMRYESGRGMKPLPAIEIKQMSGRAGRPKFDTYGEAIIVARSKRDERYISERYVRGAPEEIESRLATEPALRTHILASVAGMFTRTREELSVFLGRTFSALQEGTGHLLSLADSILDFLREEGMVTDERVLSATRFGRRVAELYIDPLTGVMLRDALGRPGEKGEFPLLHMVARTPDMMHLSARKKDIDAMLEIFSAHAKELLIPEEDMYPSENSLSEIKTATVLMQWIGEMPEDRIVGHFGIGPGDLRTLVDLADWLLYSASEIGRVFGLKGAKKPLSFLRTRVRYGVREELLELVSLKGIGRVRARNLFERGYKGLGDIREAEAGKLEAVPGIGRSLADDIKRQAGNSEP
jgi:helicase